MPPAGRDTVPAPVRFRAVALVQDADSHNEGVIPANAGVTRGETLPSKLLCHIGDGATMDAGLGQHDGEYMEKAARNRMGAGSAILPAGGLCYLPQRRLHRFEQRPAIGSTLGVFDQPFRVGHHAEHVAGVVEDAGNIAR